MIPTYNAGNTLEKLLLSLRSQTLKTEIIVIDSSSTDNTGEIAQRFADFFIIIPKETFNHGLTRNIGVKVSTNEIVVFFSQDALPEDNKTLEKLVEPIIKGEVVLSYARHVPPEGTRPTEIFFRMHSYPPKSEVRDRSMLKSGGLKVFSNSNVCCAYSKKHLLNIGGFPRVILSEDLYVAARFILKGYRIMYNAEARVIHAHEYTFQKLFQRYFSIGVFYAENRWLRIYGGRGDTLRFILYQMKYLGKNYPFWIPFAFMENAIRVLALFMGFNFRFFPRALLPILSGYDNYFRP